MEPIRHVLVAVDFQGPSLRAVDYAARVARSAGASITLFHACEPPIGGYGPIGPIPASRAELHHDARRDLVALSEELGTRGIEADVRVDDGAAAEAILAGVRASGADLVVLGTHGRRGAARAVLGSVAEQVVRRCARPVVTVHEWRFDDRRDASERLRRPLEALRGQIDLTIAVRRGAVPIAIDAAKQLGTRVETFLVEPIVAADGSMLGAVAESGRSMLDEIRAALHHESKEHAERALDAARTTAQRRATWLRSQSLRDLAGYSVLLVADALPTDAIARLAARHVKALGAKHVTLAVPVCSSRIFVALQPDVDRTIVLEIAHVAPDSARVYRDEEEVTNVDAAELLMRAAADREGESAAAR